MNRRPASLPKRLHEHVVDEIGARIVRGDYLPDQTLPVEDALVAQLGVSRTVVREAVKVLAQKNLLQVRTRTGTRVCQPARWNQLDPDILRWRLAGRFDAKLISDLIDLRRIIEPAAAELAAQRSTPAMRQGLQAALAEMADESLVSEHIAADLRFHLGILEAAGNDLLGGLRPSLEGALNIAIGFSTHTKDDGLSSMALHRAVLDAIVAADPAAARSAMDRLVDSWAADCRRLMQARAAATPAPATPKTNPAAAAARLSRVEHTAP